MCVCVVSRFKCMTTHANYLAFAICETRLLLLFHLDAKIQLNFLLDISLYFMFFDILNLWILIRNLFLNLVTFSNTKKYSVIEITFNKVWLNNHMKFEIFQFDCTRNTPTLIYTNKQNKYYNTFPPTICFLVLCVPKTHETREDCFGGKNQKI